MRPSLTLLLFLSALPLGAEVQVIMHETRSTQVQVPAGQQLPKRRAVTREEFAELLGDMRATFADRASVRSTTAGAALLRKELSALMEEQGVAELNFSFRTDGLMQLDNVRFETQARLHEALLRPELEEKLTAKEKKTLAAARRLYAQCCKPSMKVREKLLALHDGLITLAHYSRSGDRMEAADLLLTPHSGVCLAYARAYALLCDLAGVPNIIQSGWAREDHAWNIVTLGGKRYHIDCTWDDPVTPGSDEQSLHHTYFLKTDEDMRATHRW